MASHKDVTRANAHPTGLVSDYIEFDEAAAPGTPAAAQARVYVKADGKIYLKDDAGTETDLTGTGAGSGDPNPGWLNTFWIGTTSAPDFYWDDDDLSTSFTAVTVSGSATWTEAQNLVSVLANGQSTGDLAAQLYAHTFSVGHEFVLPVKSTLVADPVSGNTLYAGLVFTDGTASSSNVVMGHVQVTPTAAGTSSYPLLVGRHGTMTAITTAPWVSDSSMTWNTDALFIKLIYQASNTFRLQFSPDGITYSAFGEADISLAMTPTHVGLAVSFANASDAIATFGPLRKTA